MWVLFVGTAKVTPLLPKMDETRNPLQDAGSTKLGRSRNRTYDPSRVKRVLYPCCRRSISPGRLL